MSTQPIGDLHVPKWTFGDHLRKIRRDARLTQTAFAALLEMNADTYAAWETDRNEPSQSQATAVAKRIELLLRVPAEWTLGLHDDNGPRPGASRDEGRGTVRHGRLERPTRWLMPGAPSEGLDGAQVLPFRRPGAEPEIAA